MSSLSPAIYNLKATPAAERLKETLARCYYLLAKRGMDDRTYTHLSARLPNEEAYYIYPLGLLFSEVAPDKLIKVDFNGNILEGDETVFNETGYVIHSSVYKARPDINAIFHLHTTAGVAVSSMKQGLLPLSQFAFHFYNRLSYHRYDALNLDTEKQGLKLTKDLGPCNKAMMLENHGTMTCGQTQEEALFYMLFLEEACKVQIAALSAGVENLSFPPKTVCEQACKDMTTFEQGEIGKRDFEAECRVTHFPWTASP
ncbi:MAG: hypothetical protein GW748_06485 [Alphaproteobacteria bacterium]|nr:hypothetical protein [Alphaproteobacteria bacterium]NCQ67373.1 hypothetical protein [Alphaproteobacteria bacterium]NCT06661.1 hypothetical protein [Alphaproteobacteria bacterium]